MIVLAGCGDDAEQAAADGGGDAGQTSEADADQDAPEEGGDAVPVEDQLQAWPDDAVELLPLPATLDLSTASPNEDYPAVRGTGTRPVDEVAADVESLMDELGWEDIEQVQDNASLIMRAERDDWSAEFFLSEQDDGDTFVEGGLTRKE